MTASAFILASASACGDVSTNNQARHSEPTAGFEHHGEADLDLRGLGVADFVTSRTPVEAAHKAEFVLIGTLEGVEDGGIVETAYPDGTIDRDRFMVLRVAVAEVLKAKGDDFTSGSAYLTRPRGVEAYDKEGALRSAGTVAPLRTLEHALPAGTRVLVMADEWANPREAYVTVRDPRTVPSSAILLNMYNPQSLLLDGAPTSPLHGWQGQEPPIDFDETVEQVRAALSRD